MDERLKTMKQILEESKKEKDKIDTRSRITDEFVEMSRTKRASFDAPYTEEDPLR